MKQVFYVPERGDVVRLAPVSAAGRASRGSRLAVVLSPGSYNSRVGVALVCPVVSDSRGYPFEVPLPAGLPVAGVILADRPRSLDWRASRAEPVCPLAQAVIDEALGKLRALLA